MPDTNEFEGTQKIVEIEVPSNQAIFFYEKAVKAGMDALQDAIKFMPDDNARQAQDAIYALSKFHQAVLEVEDMVQEEFVQWQDACIDKEVSKMLDDDDIEDDDLT